MLFRRLLSLAAFPATFAATVAAVLLNACRDAAPTARDGQTRGAVSALTDLPPSFQESVVATVNAPTAMAFSGDGRIFVCEQTGDLRVIKDGVLLDSSFISLNVDEYHERGLLGVALDPDFASNGYVYVYYTAKSPTLHNRISRFTASPPSANVAAPGSETIILDLDNLSASNHNGGAIHFGPDGKLYAAAGDNAVGSNAQTTGNLHGKILRINADGGIPSDNPFYGTATGKNRAIWALGLRNPYTFAIQPGTGKLYINDVGQYDWEEINEGAKGANYGWPTVEGPSSNPSFTAPLYAYFSGTSEECAITGAAFYNPGSPQFPAEYEGDFFFADYCGGWIRHYDAATDSAKTFATGTGSPVEIQVGPDGALYYLEYSSGQIRKIGYSSSGSAPSFSQHPSDRTVTEGASASFTVSATGSPAPAFQWQKNGSDINGAVSATYTAASPQLPDSGAKIRCIATNIHGKDTSDVATLHVTANKVPAAAITGPDTSFRYRAGGTVPYAGTGTDTEDGTLPASAFTWKVDFHHDTHLHPFLPATAGAKSGSLDVPNEGETSSNVWLRIHLTVTDSKGLTATVTRDVQPRKAVVSLATSPAGLGLTLDGIPVTAPHAVTGVSGMQRILGAPAQSSGGKQYEFASWSDGGAATHTAVTPDTAVTYTAVFREVPPNQAPTGAIAPDTAFRYKGGGQIVFSATGTDPEDGSLPDSSFAWRVDFHHDSHVHPNLLSTAGAKSGAFAVPDSNETSADVFYRIHLAVKDKNGAVHASYRDVQPAKVQVTLASLPAGMKMQLDGVTVTMPHTFTGVAGMKRTLNAFLGQDLDNKPYEFVSWSDSGAALHAVKTPDAGGTFTVTYKEKGPGTSIRRNP